MAGGNDRFTKILLHMEGSNGGTTFTDENAGGSAHTWTPTSATTSSTQAKFGTTALSTGAAAGFITAPDSTDFTLGSGDFTIDCWFYRSGGDGTNRFLAGQADSAATSSTRTCDFYLSSGNVVTTIVWVGATPTSIAGTTTFTAVGWNHAAAVRVGNTLKLFVNGVQEGGDVAFSGTINDSTNKYGVGALGEYTLFNWNGFIDEFRLSVGVARWTANFTPPTIPYDGWTPPIRRIRNFIEKRQGFAY